MGHIGLTNCRSFLRSALSTHRFIRHVLTTSAILIATGCSGADAPQGDEPLAESEPELALIQQGTNNTAPPIVPGTCEGLIQPVTATASSVENNSSKYAATKAIDSDMESRWSSQFSDPQWLKLDLGSVRAIKKVVLTWQNSYSTNYDLQVSNTGAEGSWSTVYTQPSGDGGVDAIDNLAASGRYLRMYSRQRKTQYGNSLYDVKVYEDACPCEDKLQPITATASSVESGTNLVATKAIDNNLNTRWSSRFSDPQWITVDLGASESIRRVVLHWETAASDTYDVQVSQTGTPGSWTNIYSTNSGHAGTQDIQNLNAQGRYLRVYSTARATQWGNSLYEIEVYKNTCGCAPPQSTALQVTTATASSVETSSLSPIKAIDGNVGTRWSSQWSNPQWLKLELAQTATITGAVLRWETAASADYDLQVSPTGVEGSWITIYTNSNGNGGTDTISGLNGTGRFVRLYSRSRTTIWGVSLWEMQVNGFVGGSDSGAVDDGNPCTVDTCNSHTPVPAGTSCADDNVCNGNETCNAAGSCTAGMTLVVDDGNPCTADSCDPVVGVVHSPMPIGTTCDDNTVCNGVERCDGLGSCAQGTAPIVDDGNVCTEDSCDPILGVLHTLTPNGTPCSDETVCNGDEACFVGACVQSSPPPEVDDANPCTADECDPVLGAVHIPAAPGSHCDDGNVCNGVSTCNGFAVCTDEPAPVVDDNNPCTADSCDPSLGVSHTAVASGTSCADDNRCNGDETCDAFGTCIAGNAPVVDDGNVCTEDSCDPNFGVVHTLTPNGTPCSDDTVCNGDEACFAGSCVQSTPAPELDDANPCTVDECDPVSGAVHTAAEAGSDCEDGDVCNGIGRCDAFAVCIFGSAPLMDDENPCTVDACDPVLGVSHTLLPAGTSCGQANACSGAATCDATGHCVAGSVVPVDDGNPCTADACDPVTGISHTPLPTGASCADSNVCNGEETCDGAGSCGAGTPLPIDDGNPCTADACDPVGGVVTHNPVAVGTSCADSNLCNGTETCNAAGACVAGPPPVLTDNNDCTTDTCDPAVGVVHTPRSSGSVCGDPSLCDGQQACNGAGECITVVPAPVINDNNPCTTDGCNPSTGAVTHVNRPNGSSCSDGNVCNGNETCSSAAVCRILFPTGAPPPVGTSCSDGNACNGAEVCAAGGICNPGTPITTNDFNPCTTDSCNPSNAVVSHTPVASGTACADGDVCNGDELCDENGICVPGTPVVLVDDGDSCTIEICDPVLGPVTQPCNNGGQSLAKKAFDGNASLYTGSNPIQTGVTPGTLCPERASLVHGIVQDAEGNPLHSVNVRVINHPEFGATRTQSDGTLQMAVNGGSLLTLEFSRFGLLTVHRQVEVQENTHAVVADVVMIAADSAVTTIDLAQGVDLQVATSGLATLLVPSTASAALQLPDGTLELLSTLNVRLTQYPVEALGLSALPADFPAAGVSTYAFEVNADEAINSGGSVEFSEPLTFYVDNFLGLPAGVSVALDYYNQSLLEWSSEDSGVVIEILAITDGGLAEVDTDGDGAADSATMLAELGIDEAELAALAELYPIGQSLWRSQVTHFSSLACTWAAP